MSVKNIKAKMEAIASAEKFDVDFAVGLSSSQVESRKKNNLSNKTRKEVTKTYVQIVFDNLFSFFNILLFGIATLMIIAGLSWEYYLFLVILFFNIVIGLACDIRARRLVDKLRLITDPKARVIREGKEEEIAVADVVLSDIVILQTGDQVPADATIAQGKLTLNESMLTGETEPVKKGFGDQVYSGSFVVAGKAYLQVNRVGVASYAESLQNRAQKFDRPKSEIKRSTLIIFGVTGIFSILIGAMETIAYIVTQLPLKDSFTSKSFYGFVEGLSGSMVAMIPSGLYLLTSMTLAVGVVHLARKRMNVQELYCIEMLARVDTICFDKTGTLTDGTMSVKKMINLSNEKDDYLKMVLGSIITATSDDNSTAKAIKSFTKDVPVILSNDSLPFDSSRKYSAATIKNEGTFVMGAYGFVPSKTIVSVASRVNSLSEEGFRVICLYRCKKGIGKGEIKSPCELIAILALSDSIKPDAQANVAWFVENGVTVKIISGDSPLTVGEIAREVGVPNAEKAISMEGIKEEEIPDLVSKYAVFGRVSPEQKAWLVTAMQKEGHKVAMTGDGVNDILALKTADCSIAMANGSAAARNVAHLVALDNDFSHLPEVVAEGRRVINNLQRTASLFLSKTTFAIIISIVFLISGWLGKSDYPFTTKNMMIWEVLSIGGAAFFISLQPNRERLTGSFLSNILRNAIPAGIAEITTVAVFYIAHLISPTFMSSDMAHVFSVIAFSAVSFVILFRICLPLDKYRLFVFGSMLTIAVGAMITDSLFHLNYFGLPIKSVVFDWGNGILLLLTIVGCSVLYILWESFLARKHHMERKKKHEDQ